MMFRDYSSFETTEYFQTWGMHPPLSNCALKKSFINSIISLHLNCKDQTSSLNMGDASPTLTLVSPETKIDWGMHLPAKRNSPASFDLVFLLLAMGLCSCLRPRGITSMGDASLTLFLDPTTKTIKWGMHPPLEAQNKERSVLDTFQFFSILCFCLASLKSDSLGDASPTLYIDHTQPKEEWEMHPPLEAQTIASLFLDLLALSMNFRFGRGSKHINTMGDASPTPIFFFKGTISGGCIPHSKGEPSGG